MCGIFGFYQLDDPANPERILESMGKALEHRGPDSNGYFLKDNLGFGIQRLKVIDLETGDQPIFSNNKRFVIVFNGEIYNYLEIKEDLKKEGFKFYTETDTEVIVNLYQKEGVNCIYKLNGMFSFAIYDIINKKLIVCRDRNGIKPLYYYYKNGRFVFSSELNSLLKYPNIEKALNYNAIDIYLTMESIPSPLSIYKDINKLNEGNFIEIDKNNFNVKRWHNKTYYPKLNVSFNSAVKRVDTLIQNSIKISARSDVKLGSFLSSGIDSVLLSYYLNKLSTKKLSTFSVGFESKSFDESKDAKIISNIIGSDHYELILSNNDILNNTFKVIDNLDEPFADPSVIPTTLLSQFVKNYVKVAICGDGGDEIFGGYPTYLARKYSNYIPKLIFSILKKSINLLPTSHNYLTLEYKLKKLCRDIKEQPDLRHIYWLGSFNADQKKYFLKKYNSSDYLKNIIFSKIKEVNFPNNWERSMFLDTCFYLINNNLHKSDFASMRNSLELRVPFLDNDLVNYANQLPSKFKYKFTKSKPILRRILERRVPIIANRKKRGFGVPISEMINHEMKEMICDTIFSKNTEFYDIFEKRQIDTLLNNHYSKQTNNRKEIWTLFIFANWLNKNKF